MEGREADYSALFAIASGEKVECETCEGSGDCATCAGTGELAGIECETCEGSGDCATCDGTGEVAPKYDDETLTEEEAGDRLTELPLGVSVKRVLRIDLSTGGPGDWIECDLDSDGTVDAVTYHFNDWFDHAERAVDSDSALWRAAEYYAEFASAL